MAVTWAWQNEYSEHIFNHLHAKFCNENIKMYLQFISFLHTGMTPLVEILPYKWKELTYSTLSISRVLMSWRLIQGIGIHDIDSVEPE